MWELVSQFVVSVFIIILSGDLLYLYYAKGWHDPNKAIEQIEVGILYALASGGVINTIRLLMILF